MATGHVLDENGLSKPVPLSEDADGVIRVSGTRVTLDTIVYAFQEGATAEEIAQQYPTVSLANIYSVISYYLHNTRRIEGYLSDREAKAKRIRRENEARFPMAGVRDRLLSRRTKKA